MLNKIIKMLPIAVVIWFDVSAFYYVAISEVGILNKAVVFAMAVMLNISLVWFYESQYLDEIAKSISYANLELIAADTEIMYKDMFSNTDKLIDLVHDHIKRAMEHLNNVRR